jgi:hypothetical protein
MQIKTFLVAAAIPFALLGCPDKAGDTKPDPAAASAKPAATGAKPAAPSTAPAAASAPAKSGGW